MGACFNSYSVDGKKTAQELKADFQRVQEQDRYENGHSYSGGFGQCRGLTILTNSQFSTEHAADEWLADNTKKWADAKAVRYVRDGTERWMIGGWCAE